MKITWLGHASFRIEVAGEVLLLDPWVTGNPVFPEARRAEAIAGATAVLVTHAHGDHAADAPGIAVETGAQLCGIYDWIGWVAGNGGPEGLGFSKGGTIRIGEVAVTMVHATHSSSAPGVDGGPPFAGSESGFMIEGGGKTLYAMGDTDVMADMGIFAELHRPTHALVPIGGHFTMDSTRAAYACKKFFEFEAVIPCHYATFPLLEQSADAFVEKVAPLKVLVPEVMGTIEI
ncbi:MAG: metal-dependent hydrolase [Pseudomonadota bacterium]